MSPTEYFRLVVLCLCLLDSGVYCEDTQKGYVLRVQAGQTPKGVHSDERDHKRRSELPILRIPTAGFKTSSVAGGQSGSQPAQEDHTTASTSPQIQSRYPYPVHRNVPKSQVNRLKKGFGSATVAQGRSAVVHERSGTKAFPFLERKKIHRANSDSVFSTDAVQVPPHVYRRLRTKLTGGSSPQAEEAPVGFGPSRGALIYSHDSTESLNIKAVKSSLTSESRKMHIKPSRPNIFPTHPHGSHLPTRPEVSGNPGSNSAGKEKTPTWSPRSSGSDMSEARGYAHVRHMKPSTDKTQPQASSATGIKFLETGFPSVIQNQGRYSHGSSERWLKLNNDNRGKQPSSWHPPPPSHVQGKFKPFQRLSINDPPHHHSSDGEMAPTQTSAGTTLSPYLNCTGINSSVVPSADGELSTTSASPMQTESRDGELSTESTLPMQTESQDGELSTESTLPMQTESQDGELSTESTLPMQTESQDGELSNKSASSMQTESQDAKLVPKASNHDGPSESLAEVGPSLEKDKPFTVFPLTVQPAEEEGSGDKVVSSPLEKDQSEV